MNLYLTPIRTLILAIATLLTGCVSGQPAQLDREALPDTTGNSATSIFQKDRAAILAMAGNYRVKFDFIETVSFADTYQLKDRKLSGAYEIVRVIKDTPDFISLQHILIVGGEEKFAIKHWRQDWKFEPLSVLTFIGGNAWENRRRTPSQVEGQWSQTVYQVDDAPRYGAIGAWSHKNGISSWTPPAEWRPLPRRDATKRNDYHAVDAVNRHTITPNGWVHEQNNSKLILTDSPQVLVREVGINTYIHSDEFDTSIGDDYWEATHSFWAAIRNEWTRIEARNELFGLTIQGEPEELYMKILDLAEQVRDGDKSVQAASTEARIIIPHYVTTDIGTLDMRLTGNTPDHD